MTGTRHTAHTPPHLAKPKLTRPVGEDQGRDFFQAMMLGFMEDSHDGEFEIGRSVFNETGKFGFKVGDTWISTYDSVTREMVVPGGQVPVSAVTAVTVAAPYRRKGLLTKMMHEHLKNCAEPVALLWASEAGIYGRFGYGESVLRGRLKGETTDASLLPEIDLGMGSVDELPFEQWLPIASQVRESILEDRPGSLTRDEPWWRFARFHPNGWREGASDYRFIVDFDADGKPDGYAWFRIKPDWAGPLPNNEIQIREIDSADSQSFARLWKYLMSIDFVRRFSWSNAPVDGPVRYMAQNPRAVGLSLEDATYCRIIDVREALTARQYADDVDVTFELVDEILPDNCGAYRLAVEGGQAAITKARRKPDVTMNIRDLGAIYLGGVPLTALVRAGRASERADGRSRAMSRAFGWHRAPHCPDFF